MVKFFKIIATLEGISLLVLLFFAYVYRVDQLVRIIGMAHGMLFITYIVLAIMLFSEEKWPVKKLLIVCVASVIPFGTFYIENKYFKQSSNA
ncbi:DUF3817 domain-containing protein [Flavobacterium alkalisoli]|uniref:DUF3817 domain-containing protein n=1 Tax=Flavobacterium alkalisoli TaxID=2602769 RepID=A0A5B9FXV7_9FLAO|nr:DUF3817 domain-containing protein [Flavobacterium alkalisoli]QEE50598.1 DUF3817 domain-containing protein [Flavobacterium alkalisoli]